MDLERPTGGAPRFCYVLMCHSDPEVSLRLAQRVLALSPAAAVLLRHSRGPGWVSQERAREAGVEVLESTTVPEWGEWSLTSAMLEALAAARERLPADRYVIVSGQDHPVRPLDAWEREVVAGGSDAVLHHTAPAVRDHGYAWHPWQPPQRVPLLLRRATAAGWRAVTPVVRPVVQANPVRGTTRWTVGLRRTPGDRRAPVPVVKASAWVHLSARAMDSVLARLRDDPAVRSWFSRVRISDEYLVASLLHADPALRIQEGRTTYTRFAPGSWSPSWVDAGVLELARASGAPFVRKVADGADDVRALADAAVDAQRPRPGR